MSTKKSKMWNSIAKMAIFQVENIFKAVRFVVRLEL